MRQNIYIRKLFATSLLLIFAFSITPTKVLHSLFANHKDANVKDKKASNIPILSVAVFNCQCDNLVVESPFTLHCQPIVTNLPELFFINNPAPELSVPCTGYFYFELRGPPSLA
ncbi:MAG: hypothetical protein ABIO81_02235 [Ginsengibacter sp.]